MDLNSTYAPPINNACVPDIYNRLDADVIERTRVANKQLNIRLLLQQKILLKYKQEAERFLMVEKSRVARELARITQRLPTVVSLQAIDESVNQSEHPHLNKKKSYMAAKNEDPVCRRCYIHHLPSKKRFYRFRSHQPPSTVLESKTSYHIAGNHHHDQKLATKSLASNVQDGTENDQSDPISLDVSRLSPHDQFRQPTDRFIPGADTFKFLDRDKWGRETDLNHGAAPRLMPNELWKNFVKTISSQCGKHQGIPTNTTRFHSRNDRFFHEKTTDKKSGPSGRRPSIVSANKNREKSEQFTNVLRKSSSRMNLYRGASVISHGQSHENTHPLPHQTPSPHETNSNISARKRPPLSKTNSFSRSLSRSHHNSSPVTSK